MAPMPETGRPVETRQSRRVGVGAGRGQGGRLWGARLGGRGGLSPSPPVLSSPRPSRVCFSQAATAVLRALVTRTIDVGRTSGKGNLSHDTRCIPPSQTRLRRGARRRGVAQDLPHPTITAQAFSWRCRYTLRADGICDGLAEMRIARPGCPCSGACRGPGRRHFCPPARWAIFGERECHE